MTFPPHPPYAPGPRAPLWARGSEGRELVNLDATSVIRVYAPTPGMGAETVGGNHRVVAYERVPYAQAERQRVLFVGTKTQCHHVFDTIQRRLHALDLNAVAQGAPDEPRPGEAA